MKNCSRCGAPNATRAQFCNVCGAKFRIADAIAAPEANARNDDARNDDGIRADNARKKRTTNDASLAPKPRESGGRQTKSGAFWSTAAVVCAALWRALRFVVRRAGPFLVAALRKTPAFFATLGTWLKIGWKKTKPAREKIVADAPRYGAAAWSRVRVALAPSATWTPERIPNFLIWGVVDFFLWRLPFSIVGIFYAILANEAKRTNDFELARIRAAKAKGWLVADLAIGATLAIFATFGFLGRVDAIFLRPISP